MGETSGKLSDLTILTSDNPRQEDPLKIISDIVVGAKVRRKIFNRAGPRESHFAGHRGSAARRHRAAGRKGHEDYQIFADRTIHFDDRESGAKSVERSWVQNGKWK